jgi:hypothetical protein
MAKAPSLVSKLLATCTRCTDQDRQESYQARIRLQRGPVSQILRQQTEPGCILQARPSA